MEMIMRASRGKRWIRDYALHSGEILVGRSEECELKFGDARMSREHCKLVADEHECTVVDLSSTNGTFVNGRRVHKAELKDGDRITVGRVRLVLGTATNVNDETKAEMEVDMKARNKTEDIFDEGHYWPRDGRGAGETGYGAIIRTRPTPALPVHDPMNVLLNTVSPPQSGREAGSSMRQILKYKKTIALVALVIFIPSIVAIWTLMKPYYSAVGQVRVRPIIPHLVFQTEESGTIPFYQSYLNTQVGVIRSPTVLQRVLDQPDVQSTEWYNRSDPFWQGPRTRLERLGEGLFVQPRGMTELIDVSFKDTSSEDATVIVNATLGQYISYLSERSEEGSDMMFRQLSREFQQLDETIRGRETEAAKLRKQLGTANPGDLVAGKRVRLDEMRSELDSVRRKLAIAELRRKELENRLEAAQNTAVDSVNMAPSQSKYQLDPEWERLHMGLRVAKHKVELESQRLGYAHPSMVALKQEVGFAEELLTARQRQLDLQWPAASTTLQLPVSATGFAVGVSPVQELEDLKWQVKLLAQEEKLLLEDLAKNKSVWEDTFDRAEILGAEISSIEQKKQLSEAVRNRLEQKRMERNVPGSIEILAQAVVPSVAANDRRLAFTVLAVIVGIGSGLGIAYLRAGGDQAIYQTGELTGAAAAPFLGQLPQISAAKNRPIDDDPFLNEGIRMARTSLLQQMSMHKGNVIVITSAERGVGKTTVSVMLARSLARSGKRALLVDADLRNPSVASRMELYPQVGFAQVISGDADDSQAILPTDDPRFDILPGCIMEHGFDPELIANGALCAALDRWRGSYDVVILDSPPVLAVADARILAHHADGVILIAWAGRTQRNDIHEATESINLAGGSLTGTIFVQRQDRSHYGHQYDYAYGVQS